MNEQPEEGLQRDPNVVEAIKCFNTIQGEGPLAGRPATFVRLAGCNLMCPLCDTEYTAGRQRFTVEEAVHSICTMSRRDWLVVLTGGEPFRQVSLPRLIDGLIYRNRDVQIETNGTLWQDLRSMQMIDYCMGKLTIVCSPKAPRINPLLAPHIDAYKYVVEHGKVDPNDGLPTTVLGNPWKIARPPRDFKGPVFVQPCDSMDPALNRLNTKAAIASCMLFNYRLCVQVHKIVGLD